ncbi:MAG: glycosyltransferase [Proteobacteria bacterium]|nr:glycosyltransferase [Pseudomonadota bacterium]
MQKTTIVIPCYNEARRLKPEMFLKEVSENSWLHLLFIDDGSSDDTLSILKKLSKSKPDQITYEQLPTNKGKAEAVRIGVLTAMACDSKLIGYLDADLSAPLSEFKEMTRLIFERDAFMVLGSRVKLLGRDIVRSRHRHYLGRVFATLASIALDMPVYDTQCGAKLFRNNDLAKQVFSEPFNSRWIFDVEILARVLIACDSMESKTKQSIILEYPLAKWHQIDGSRLKPIDFAKAALDLAEIAIRRCF